MSTLQARAPVQLVLSEGPGTTAVPAPWIGPLLAFGARVSRYEAQLGGRQLVAAISVPRRDFAAALIGCGWVMARPAPELLPPLELMRQMEPGTPVRVVTDHYVITDHFRRLDENVTPPRLYLAHGLFIAEKVNAMAVLPRVETAARTGKPHLGTIGKLARLDETWDARMASPAADLAIVGTIAWLRDDIDAYIAREGDRNSAPTRVTDLLLSEGKRRATWSTRLYASARFADRLPLPKDLRAVVLDGFGAIKYLAEIETPIVVCILDRSVADETAAELIVQLRNTRGDPLSITEDVGWRPPAGVEALPFTMAL